MTDISSATIWTVTVLLGLGTYLIRFSFLGLIGDRKLPAWAQRMLRYVPVAVMPGLVTPLVIWPGATEGQPDPARMGAALVTLLVGGLTKNALAAIVSGMATLYGLLWLL